MKNSNKRFSHTLKAMLVLFCLLTSGWSLGQQSRVLLKTGTKGEVITGFIERLITTIQEGKAIRIGWQFDFDDDGAPNLEHWIDANFLSILNGHVFNQIEPIYGQLPMEEIPQIQIKASKLKWTAVIGSNGKLMSRYIYADVNDVEDNSERKYLEGLLEVSERIVPTIWVLKE